MRSVFEKKKRNYSGSITYGSGSRKKNRGSGNSGGVGKGGLWDHKKGLAAKIRKTLRRNRIKTRKKLKRQKEIIPGFLNSKKYLLRLAKRGISVDPSKKIIKNSNLLTTSSRVKLLKKKGYKFDEQD